MASVNVIDEKTYNTWHQKPELTTSSLRIYAYNSHEPLHTLGKFSEMVSYNNKISNAEFYVIEGYSGNLLSYTTSEQLNLITLNTIHTIQTNT